MQAKISRGIIAIVVLFLMVGCSDEEETINLQGIAGEIVEIDGDSFLIQSNDNKVDLKYTNDTVFEGKNRNEFSIGDRVKTWYASEQLDTNPVQAAASKIEFIE